MASPELRWTRVSRAQRCPICGKPDGCLLSPDGAVALCIRLASDSPVPAQRGLGGWYHRLSAPSSRPLPSLPDLPLLHRPLAPLADRHRVYQALLEELGLSLAHRRHLSEKRRMTIAQAEALGYSSLPHVPERRRAVAERLQDRFGADLLLSVPGFVRVRGHLTLAGPRGILIPVRSPRGLIQALQIRRDQERSSKYVWFSSAAYHGPSSGALCHLARPLQGTTSNRVWLTEGPLKADLSASLLGERVLAIPGVGSTKDLPVALQELQSDLDDELEVILALDADWETKPQVAQARERIAESLAQAGWAVHLAYWPHEEGKGLDDVLQRGFAPVTVPYRANTCGPRPLEAREPEPMPHSEPGWTVEKLRRELPRALDRALTGNAKALLVKTPPGTGKTHALTDALNRLVSSTRRHAAVFVPRHDLAAGAGRDSWTHVYGRTRPTASGSRPCAFSDRMARVSQLRLPAADACQTCPLLKTCRENGARAGEEPWYWAQFANLGKISVFPAEHLRTPELWSGASVIVIDDVDLRQLLMEKVTITLDECRQTLDLLERPEYAGLLPAQLLLQLTADWLHHRDRHPPEHPLTSDQWLAEWTRWAPELREAVDQAMQAKEPELFSPGKDLRQVELARPKRFILDLAQVLRHELTQFEQRRPWNSRVTLRKHVAHGHLVLDLHLRRELARSAFTGKTLIVLNASCSRTDLEELFPDRPWDVFEPRVAVPAGVEVIQLADRNFGKTHLLKVQDDPKQLTKELEFLMRYHRHRGHRMGAITHKPLTSKLREIAPDLAVTGHFFGQRGSNDFEDCQALFVIGTPWPNPHDLLQQARTLYWDGPLVQPTERLRKRRLGRSEAGQDLWTSVRTYADPRLQRLLEARREEELIQAVGRARIFNLDTSPGQQLQLGLFESGEVQRVQRQRVRVYVLSGLPLPLDNLVIRSDRVLEGARLQAAAAQLQGQGILLSRRTLADAADTSQRQASQWLIRWRAQGSPSVIPDHPVTSDPPGNTENSPLQPPPFSAYRGPLEPDLQRLSRPSPGAPDRVDPVDLIPKRSSAPELPPQTLCAKGSSSPRSSLIPDLPRSGTLSPPGSLDHVADRLRSRNLPVSRRRLAKEAQISERQATQWLKNLPLPPVAAGPLPRERLEQAVFTLSSEGHPITRRKLAHAAATSERQAQNWIRQQSPPPWPLPDTG